ncbi:hypothetical protein SELMODRAFT_418582 [Selaginella moellendorffii]|uniref:Uncharacterized protein n=1 Tax=Selaginella moellendorffii TaxID=88036 RepID=D8S659_SELML|nr:hypothetical protein SELMODRAFT_418582 [Selaginella moellendorffii]
MGKGAEFMVVNKKTISASTIKLHQLGNIEVETGDKLAIGEGGVAAMDSLPLDLFKRGIESLYTAYQNVPSSCSGPAIVHHSSGKECPDQNQIGRWLREKRMEVQVIEMFDKEKRSWEEYFNAEGAPPSVLFSSKELQYEEDVFYYGSLRAFCKQLPWPSS